jgi:hypothetical protein
MLRCLTTSITIWQETCPVGHFKVGVIMEARSTKGNQTVFHFQFIWTPPDLLV